MNSEADEKRCTKLKFRLAGFWASMGINILFLIPIASIYGIEDYPFPVALPWIVNGLLFASFFFSEAFVTGHLISLGVLALASLLYVPSCMVACYILGGSMSSGDSFFSCFLLVYLLGWLGLAGWLSHRAYKRHCLALDGEEASIETGSI